MKRLFISIITSVFVLPLLATTILAAETPTPTITKDPERIVYDPECTKFLIVGEYENAAGEKINAYEGGVPFCNDRCRYNIIYNDVGGRRPGTFCVYGSETDPLFLNDEVNLSLPIEIPAEDAILIWIRSGIYAVMGVTSLALILYGLYGWYLRAMSEGEEEKIRLSVNIYKNAIIGGIIVFLAALVTQLVFMFLGVTESILEFNFIPKSGYEVEVTDQDTGRLCYENQTDVNGVFECIENKWVKKTNTNNNGPL